MSISRRSVSGRAFVDRRTVAVDDVADQDEFPEARENYERFKSDPPPAPPISQSPCRCDGRAHRRAEHRASASEVRPFTARQIALLETFADQAVIAIENARLFERASGARSRELQALGEVGQALSSSLDLQEVLTTIVANAIRLAGADGGVVYEFDEADGVFEVRAADRMTDDLATTLRARALPPRRGRRWAGGRHPSAVPGRGRRDVPRP